MSPSTLFLLAKALHLVAAMSWLAGLLYLPRLFIYHKSSEDTLSRQRFSLMESRLYWRIMTPAMLLTLLAGFAMIKIVLPTGGWLHAKLMLILLLVVFHFSCQRYMYRLKNNQPMPSDRALRFYNEIPAILMIGIVFLAVFRIF